MVLNTSSFLQKLWKLGIVADLLYPKDTRVYVQILTSLVQPCELNYSPRESWLWRSESMSKPSW